MHNFLRRIEVEFIFTDMNGTYRRKNYISTGKRDGLAIAFSGVKTLVSAPNECTIEILNMSSDMKKELVSNVRNIAVKLYANYETQPRSLLFSGDLLKAWPEREGTTNKMTLSFLDGVSAILNGISNHVWNPGTDLRTVVMDVASDMPGIKIDPTKINVFGQIPERGCTCTGSSKNVLDDFSNVYDFNWSIENGVFQAYSNQYVAPQASQRTHKISVEQANLLKATPELGDKYMNMVGMKISAVLDAKVHTGDIIELTSTVYPDYSGTYLVHEVSFTGETFGPNWSMEITSKQTSNQYRRPGAGAGATGSW